jgi:adenosylhomocysteine nucleosidase
VEQIDILILCALRPEASAISSRMVGARCLDFESFAGHLGKFSGKTALLVRAGPGGEKSADGLQAALKEYHPRLIVNFGTAGAIADDLQPGDCVVSRESLAYDPAILGAADNANGASFEDAPAIALNENLAGQLSKMAEYRLATFGSADYSVADNEARSTLRALFDLDVVDWETYSVLHAAKQAKVPAFSFRAVTDLAGPNAEQEFRDNHRRIVEDAGKRLGDLIGKLDLENLTTEV